MSIQTINTMVNWLETNIKDNPTLNDMSDYVGYSSFYCSSKFHEVVGMSFKSYVRKRKLSLAANELIHKDYRIIDIAVKYGFSSNEAFTRAFKNEYGCSPSVFRRYRPKIETQDRITI